MDHKKLTLIASILGSGVVFLDGSVVNVALPAPDDVSLSDELEAVARRWLRRDPGDGPAPATMAEALRVAELCEAMYSRLSEQQANSP